MMKNNPSTRVKTWLGMVAGMILTPALAFAQAGAEAQGTGAFSSLGRLVDNFTNTVVAALGSLFVAAGTVAFFYGMVQYIWGRQQGDAGKTKVGNSFMVWGLVGVFVMVSVWGIVFWFQGIFGIQNQNNIVIPRIQIGGSSSGRTGTVNAGPLTPISSPGGTTSGGSGANTGSAASSDPNAICRAYGPGTGCMVGGQAGACSASNICVSQAELTP